MGGTGAQGIPVVRGLVKDKKYACRVLTRDPSSQRAKELFALGNVEIVEGSFASEATLRAGYHGCDGAFVNIDGFNTGEKTELFWAIRAYELAIEEGVKFFVYGNLDFAYKKGAYDPKYRAGWLILLFILFAVILSPDTHLIAPLLHLSGRTYNANNK